MKTKKVFLTEWAYVLGILILAFGTALMERADFGMSMVVAPAYLLHLKISQFLPWFSFGMSEYVFQAVLLIVISVVMGRFHKGYLFSFVTAVFYGLMLDLCIAGVSVVPNHGIAIRIMLYILGMIFCSIGVAMLFRTYISPEAYELLVKEIARKYQKDISKVKTVYDCCSCLIGIILSFAFFGLWHFEGVKLGTIVCALINGWMIGRASAAMEVMFCFRDGLPLRKYFESMESAQSA